MCTGILEKVVHHSNRDVNDNYDAVSFWRRTYWKRLSAVQLMAPERYRIEFALAGCKCGKPFATLVCTPFTRKLPIRLHCTYRVLPLTVEKPAALHKHFVHRRGCVQQRWNERYMEFRQVTAFPSQHFHNCWIGP